MFLPDSLLAQFRLLENKILDIILYKPLSYWYTIFHKIYNKFIFKLGYNWLWI